MADDANRMRIAGRAGRIRPRRWLPAIAIGLAVALSLSGCVFSFGITNSPSLPGEPRTAP